VIFLNESVRREFHLLSPEKQSAIQDVDSKFQERGLEIKILHIDGDDISLNVERFVENSGLKIVGDDS
jgi:hypothetical protein